MGFRYCWKYISSVIETTSVLMEVIDIENAIVVNMDSNFHMTLIHFNAYKKGRCPKQYTIHDNTNKFLPCQHLTDLAS